MALVSDRCQVGKVTLDVSVFRSVADLQAIASISSDFVLP